LGGSRSTYKALECSDLNDVCDELSQSQSSAYVACGCDVDVTVRPSRR
jgi:hypothetical protein